MARYRKIDPRIWNDAKFRSLNERGKLAFLFLLTHPGMTCLGAMRATTAGLAAELGWTPDAMRDAIHDAIRNGMVEASDADAFWALPNWLRYNAPEGPNSVKAWPAALDLLPECALRDCYPVDAIPDVYRWQGANGHTLLRLRPLSEAEHALGDFSSGRFAWLLWAVSPVTPVACRGAQGLWTVPPDVERMVRKMRWIR